MEAEPNGARPRDAGNWAKPIAHLKTSGLPADALNVNVDGKQLTGPLRGFGQLWQKTYRIDLRGADIKPAQLVQEWKSQFATFWPKGNYFWSTSSAIAPGDVAVLNLDRVGRVSLVTTGIMVIYADEESFTFMTPEGHPFAGFITFSAFEEDGCTVAQAQALIRANDPVYEIGMRLGIGRKEDRFWHQTLAALAAHFGIQGTVTQTTVLVDPKLQWSRAGNIWHNAGARTAVYTFTSPFRRLLYREK